MAFSTSGGSGGGGGYFTRSRFRGGNTMSDMNVVPLVDVMMVLLVIFMLTAHVMEFGMEVDVPKVRQVKDTARELPVVTITKNGFLYLNDQGVNINEIGQKVHERFGPKVDSVYVRADKDAIWNVIAQVVSVLNEAKIKINMVTQPEDETEKLTRNRR